MSAIHCCFYFDPNESYKNDSIMQKMLQSSNYWEPDALSEAFNHSKNCFLGKASLFNTAISKNDTVYTDNQTGNIITANARIDNRAELMHQLNITNTQITDGELILKAYQKWEKKCVKNLLGDFAFIIWDEKQQKIFCARDHFGVKTLLYCKTYNGIMISNEPNAFLESNWLKPQIKEHWLVKQIYNLGPEKPKTAYQNLEFIPPAHFLEVDINGLKIEKYWTLEDKKDWDNLSEKDLIEEFKKRFTKAVERRTITEFNLGAQLSEGLDSNGISGYAAKLNPQKNIFTFSYHTTELNKETEKIWAETYKDIYEMLDFHPNLKALWNENKEIEEENTEIIKNIGGAFNIQPQFLPHCVLAKKHNIKVLLSGWGGDHCVSSPGDFFESELFSQFKFKQLIQLLKDKNNRGRGGNPIKTIMRLLLKHTSPTLHYYYVISKKMGLEPSMLQRSKNSYVKDKYIKKYSLQKNLHVFLKNYQKRYSTKDYSIRELFEIGVERRLIDSEFSGRMFNLEYRFPMLDVELVEFAYNIPAQFKVFKGIERYAFREVIKGYTTEKIRLRKKADVNHPNFSNSPKNYDRENINYSILLELPLFKKYINETKFTSTKTQHPFQQKQINQLSNLFQFWYRKNIDIIN